MAQHSFTYGPFETPRDEERLAEATSVSFNLAPDEVELRRSMAGRENARVVKRDGDVVGGLLALSMGHFFGGRSVPAGGIAGVAILPEERGRGAARHLMTEVLREFRERGEPLSSLYASTFSLYRAVGYERAGWLYEVHARPSDLPRERATLRVRPATAEDEPLIEELARERARTSDGLADRGRYLWTRNRTPLTHTSRTYVIEGDEPEGHVVFHTPAQGFDTLRLADWSARTPEALQTVRAFAAEHGTMWQEIVWYATGNDPLLLSIPEKGARIDVRETWMLRITDVADALARRGYAPGLQAELHFDVADEAIPENAGRWKMRVDDGSAEVSAGGEGHLQLDVAALAMLYSGFMSAENLALMGRLQAIPAQLAAASAVFAGHGSSMIDFF